MSITKISDEAYDQSSIKPLELEELLNHSITAGKLGGEILMKNYGKLTEIKNKETIGDLVTNADIEAEKKILEYLMNQTPNIPVLAEESGQNGFEQSLMWCIDPLDGTTNFAHGYPFFATSIGLCFKNKPLLGSINIPYLKEIYFSAPQIGAFCNEIKIKVSSTNNLSNSLLVTGFAYDRTKVNDNNYAEFCSLTNKTRGVRRGGAAAVDLAFVSSGKLDGYWERGLAKWDLAAGVPLVEQAGGIISDYKSPDFDLSTGRILACAPGIEKDLKTELKKVKPLPSKYIED